MSCSGGSVAPTGTVAATFWRVGGGHSYTVRAQVVNGIATVPSRAFRVGKYRLRAQHTPAATAPFQGSASAMTIAARRWSTSINVIGRNAFTQPRGGLGTVRVQVASPEGGTPRGRLNVNVRRIGGGQNYWMAATLNPRGIRWFQTRPFRKPGRYRVVVRYVPAAGSGFEPSSTVIRWRAVR